MTVIADNHSDFNNPCVLQNYYFFPTFGAKWHSQSVNRNFTERLDYLPTFDWLGISPDPTNFIRIQLQTSVTFGP